MSITIETHNGDAKSMMADSKHLKQEHQNATTPTTDIISTLPDSILCHILSILPTKHSVATGVLSRRWRHLWEYLQVFDFDSSGYNCQLQLKRFAVFVYSVLSLRKTRDIRKFSLNSCCCSDADDDCMAKWVRAAVGPHLQQLDLSLSGPYQYEFRLPHVLFTCTGLVSLTLWGSIGLEQELASVNLPSLKTLNLDIDIVNPINQLLSGCPVLETLGLAFTVSNAPKIRMPSSLKSLTFVDESTMEIEHLEIDTPSLEYLSIDIRTKCSQFSVINLCSVVEAYVYFEKPRFGGEYDHIDSVLNLLRGLTGTKCLHLYLPTIECLPNVPVVDFPKFGFLVHLNLTLPYVNPKFLVNLLKKCVLLQILEIRDDKKSLLPSGKWIQPRNVPKCLRLHLINVEFQGYQDCANQRAFMTYILKRGLVLKTVKIQTCDSLSLEKKHRILKKLSIVPRGSSMCQLNFH